MKIVYGSANVSLYTCQNTGCANNSHGGQCKAFTDLVTRRSGVYSRTLPNDAWISAKMPLVSPLTIQAGDVLRKTTPNPHSLIVVRVIDSNKIVVIDSNWVGGLGYEKIGSHIMSFYLLIN